MGALKIIGNSDTIAYAAWPSYNEEYLKVDEVEILVQIKGKPNTGTSHNPGG